MTIQNNTTIGLVIVGKGYPRNGQNQRFVRPQHMLSEFLNVDTSKVEQIDKFCEKFKIVPRDWTKGFYDGFVQEQIKIVGIVKRHEANEINKDDIDQINNEIKNISVQIGLVPERYFIGINSQLSNVELNDGEVLWEPLSLNGKRHYSARFKRYPNTISQIYEMLAELILREKVVLTCRNCGKYFIPNKQSPWQKYCNAYCKDRYISRKKYHEKKRLNKLPTPLPTKL